MLSYQAFFAGGVFVSVGLGSFMDSDNCKLLAEDTSDLSMDALPKSGFWMDFRDESITETGLFRSEFSL